MSAFDSALRSRANPDALSGKKPRGVAGQVLLSDEWGLDELPEPTFDNALAGHVGGQWRIQEVLTPDDLLDVAREALGGRIVLDPCAPSDPKDWFAERNISLAPEALPLEDELERIKDQPNTRKRQKELTALLKPYYLGGALKCSWGDWRDGTFVNPPFMYLEQWLARCQREARENFRRIVTLWPVRTHRAWWVAGHAGAEVVLLSYDVKFKGHRHAFPAALCLASWNCRIPPLGKRETGRWRP